MTKDFGNKPAGGSHSGEAVGIDDLSVYVPGLFLPLSGEFSLDRGIDGVPFGKTANGGIPAVDIAEVPPPFHHGFNIPVLFSQGNSLIDIGPDPGIPAEILLNDFRCFLTGNIQPFG